MIPNVSDELLTLAEETQPGLTYALDIENGRVRGKTDGLDALKQAVYLILSTERYENLIYSYNYGVELDNLIGQPREYALPEVERRIAEALKQDDRVSSVDNFIFENGRNAVHVTFTVHSDLGEMEVTTDVRR